MRELLGREFLPSWTRSVAARRASRTQAEIERLFTTSSVAGKPNPNIIQKSIVATRRINPERPDLSWQGLFGMVTLSDSGYAEHYQILQQSLEYLAGNLVYTKDGDYKREGFEEGAPGCSASPSSSWMTILGRRSPG